MLALLAVVLVTLFSFGQQRLRMKAEQDMVRDELAMVAEGVLLERLTELSRLPFAALPGEHEEVVTYRRRAVGETAELVFEVETAVQGVRLVNRAWTSDPSASPAYLEVVAYVRGPLGAGIALPERTVGGRQRGAIYLKRIIRKNT